MLLYLVQLKSSFVRIIKPERGALSRKLLNDLKLQCCAAESDSNNNTTEKGGTTILQTRLVAHAVTLMGNLTRSAQ